jgi:MurNAc alpha-1-phosphate uridylyltransferase
MILAAGRGERMRPLTDSVPKPLLEAGGKPLIVWQIERLAAGGWRELVINIAHLGNQVRSRLGDGRRFGVKIEYSVEDVALETAGGIAYAMPFLGSDCFLVANCDVYCDFDYGRLRPDMLTPSLLAHLVLVDNPPHHSRGDFGLREGKLAIDADPRLTFSGIGLYRPELFAQIERGAKAPLAPLISRAAGQARISAERHEGIWMDIGTPERLERLDAMLRDSASTRR